MSRPETARFVLLAGSSWLVSLFVALLLFAGLASSPNASTLLLVGYVAALLLDLGLAVLVVFLAAPRFAVPTATRLVATLVLGSLQLVTFALLAFIGLLKNGGLS